MMNLKKLCSTFILTLVLATYAFAGTMEGGEIAPPTPPAAATTLCGEMECPAAQLAPNATTQGSDVAAAAVAGAALSLVGSVVALF